MTKEKFIYGMYNDDDLMIAGIKQLQAKGIHVRDAYSPFPVHGLEDVLGIKWTRIAIAAFIYGITGLTLAVLAINYMMIIDWPLNIGGKPNFHFYQNVPAFVPIMFEFTVLCAAHGMAFVYFLRNGILPGMPSRNPDPRTTDDRFVVEIRPEENSQFSMDELNAIVKSTPIVELEEKVIK